MREAPPAFIIGWEEWVALPELGLPAIRAKVDTGARTSALHAFLIEPFGPARAPMVRFGIHPVPGRDDIEVYGTAEVVDRRAVTSSNGEKEARIFIRTPLTMGERTWIVEIGLTNREAMSYRMLLGRQAIRTDMVVAPRSSFHQPRLSYRLYRNMPQQEPQRRRLRIALVAKDTGAPSIRLLERAAVSAGHELHLIELARTELAFDPAAPGILHDGVPVPSFDAVIARVGVEDGRPGAAIVRQLEMMGAVAVNGGDALDRRANPLAERQVLGAAGIAVEIAPPEASDAKRGRKTETVVRVLVVGGKAVAAMPRQRPGRKRAGISSGMGIRDHRAECRIGERAAAALRLGLVAVDVDGARSPPRVRAITARPALSRWGAAAGAAAADAVIALVEAGVRTLSRKSVAAVGSLAVEPE